MTARGTRWRRPLLSLALFLCQSCAIREAPPHVDPALRIPARTFHFQDGGQAIYFSFDKSLSLEPAPAGQPQTLVFVVSGSGCNSMQYFLPRYFRGLEGESGPLRISILQKRFIDERAWNASNACSRAFVEADHLSRWLADQTEFILHELTMLRDQHIVAQRIVIVGISEGGDMVPLLTRQIPGVTHAVILANGGMDPLDAYRLQAIKHGRASGLDTLAALDRRPSEPDAPAHDIGGRTWRYWAELRDLRHTDNLLAMSIPVWMAMGDADLAVPVESALFLRDQFLQHRKTNLNLHIFHGAGHSLQIGNKFLLENFWFALDNMLKK
ncbi:MAG: hypothetical protein H7315_09060 [Herminiimonas sp.]|nr:hypothetical protein [Herminiimonas sp.]